MIEKQPYVDKLLYLKDTIPMSIYEISKELEVTYNTLRKILDVQNNEPIRALTARKIQAFINKYEGCNKNA